MSLDTALNTAVNRSDASVGSRGGGSVEEALERYNVGALERANGLLETGLQRNTLYVPEGGPAAVTPPRELLNESQARL